ncbi:aminomethyl transferase family protein [Arthrobacter sp. NPDC056727]|uniref:aminomethyl transferase family protein n=1 Tax=Arthrobacter sp. NPDC056727 TaxID=3345927 RepID=UPI00366BD450
MSQGNSKSLQDLIDATPDLVDHFYNDTTAAHFSRSGTKSAAFIPPAFSNWRDEQQAWTDGAVLFHQSHHMPELFLEGPDAFRLLQKLAINSFANFTLDRAKQFVAVTPSGHVIGDCIVYRHSEESFELVSGMPVLDWVHYNAETGGYDVTVKRDDASTTNPTGRRVKYRFQLDGPNAGRIFGKAIDGEVPTIPFFRVAKVTIAGCEVLVLRHGMSGHQGVELSGPYEDEETVRNALLEAGKDDGLLPAGTQAYFSTPLSSAWMAYPVPAIFTGEELRGFREWLGDTSWEANTQLGGSFYSSNIEDYYVTPHELGYEHVIKYDHDFVGREALENRSLESHRKRVTLVWNHEDLAKVWGSQFGPGPRYKSLEFPVAYYAFNQFDEVRNEAGELVGVSCHAGYLNPEGEMLSLAMLDRAHSEPGTEVVLTWGEINGGSRKPQVEKHEQTTVRAIVAPAPYARDVQRMQRETVGAR